MRRDRATIAVIGAGFSGTMTALHLLDRLPSQRILLCERGPTFGRGPAYSTGDPAHLLNVRAGNMSAFPDRPDHFVDWLGRLDDVPQRHLHDTPVGVFVSRAVYGRYLSSLVQDAVSESNGAARLRIVPDEVVGLERASSGGFTLRLAGGRSHDVTDAVLAVGNLTAGRGGEPGTYVENPWEVPCATSLEPGRPVIVVGSGLTMVDVVVSLWSSGFSGPVVAISRRGLVSRMHAAPAPWRSGLPSDGPQTMSGLLRAVRREVGAAARAGIPWQSVIDAMRPITAPLWRSLPAAEQARFIRHLRPWWDVHRHRMAPPVGQQIHGLIRQGYLSIVAGQVRSVQAEGDEITVAWQARGETDLRRIVAQRVVVASGPRPLDETKDGLLGALMRSGLARPDRHGLGLDVTDDLELVDRDGQVVQGLWALGPIVRGTFWECTAVPDIRNDASRLAARIGAHRPA